VIIVREVCEIFYPIVSKTFKMYQNQLLFSCLCLTLTSIEDCQKT
jgi:hypothetical protein